MMRASVAVMRNEQQGTCNHRSKQLVSHSRCYRSRPGRSRAPPQYQNAYICFDRRLEHLCLPILGRKVTGLQLINFGSNAIGDAGAKKVSEALSRSSCRRDALNALSLSRNEIGSEGANVRASRPDM